MSESARIETDALSETGVLDLSSETGRETTVSDPPAFDPDRPAKGTVLEDRYEVGELLGQGGMGYVLAAHHVILRTRLALKVLRREMTREPEMVERFRREARAASAIGHPNIVEVRDFGTLPSSDGVTPGASYFVMEHLEGQGLDDAIEKDGPFSVERAIDIVRQMADALEAAHAQGIIHRDVKPENVMLTVRNGRADHVKILDFGIAKLDSAVKLSGAFRVLGTPAYMSPEQAQGQPLDHRSDVYSLGIVLYELLTGVLPFEDPRPFEMLRLQVTAVPPSVLALRPDVPEVIAETIARALEKDREKRPASMRAMMDMLAPFAMARSVELRWRSTASSAPAPEAVPRDTRVEAIAPTRMALAKPVAPELASRASTPVPTVRAAGPRAVWVLGVAAVIALGAAAVIGTAIEREARRSVPATTAARVPDVAAPPISVAASPPPVSPGPTIVDVAPVPSPLPTTTAPAHPHPHRQPVSAALAEPTSTAPPETPVAQEPVRAPDSRPTAQVIDPWDG